MATAFVQSNTATSTSSNTTLAVALTGCTAGSLIVLYIAAYGSTVEITSALDDLSNAFTADVAILNASSGGIGSFYVCSLPNVTAGNRTFTVTWSGNVQYKSLIVHEVSGVATTSPLTGTPSAAAGNSANLNSGPTTPAVDGAYIFGVGSTGGGAVPTAAEPFTTRASESNLGSRSEDYIQATAAAINATLTVSSAKWVCLVAAYKPTAGAGAKVPVLMNIQRQMRS
jgi:hypothetical protein